MGRERFITPKHFINHVLMNEIEDIVNNHTYLSFTLIAVGIEFIGKCNLIGQNDWNNINASKAFNKGVELLTEVDERYGKIDLKDELRNGLAHTFLPKSKVVLSGIKSGEQHFGLDSQGKTILVAETFFMDFATICRKTIEKEFPESDKMNQPLIRVGE